MHASQPTTETTLPQPEESIEDLLFFARQSDHDLELLISAAPIEERPATRAKIFANREAARNDPRIQAILNPKQPTEDILGNPIKEE